MSKLLRTFNHLSTFTICFAISFASVASSAPYVAFEKKQERYLNVHKRSHDLAKAIIQSTDNKQLVNYSNEILSQKNFVLPHLTINKNELRFQFRNVQYSVTHISGSKYLINNQVHDIKKSDWFKKYSNFSPSYDFLLFPKLEAAFFIPPIYWLIIGAVGAVAFSCSSVKLNGKPSTGRKNLRISSNKFVRDLNRELNKATQGLRKTCMGANASEMGMHLDYSYALSSYCKALTQDVLVASKGNSRAPKVFKSNGDTNPQFFKYMKQHPKDFGVNTFNPTHVSKLNIPTCLDPECAEKGSTRMFRDLDEAQQKVINDLTSNPTIMGECVKDELTQKEEQTPTRQQRTDKSNATF